VSWAGARGVLPLAAALSIPLATPRGERDLVLLLTAAVIVTTLVVQGFTLGPLVRRSGVALPPGHDRDERDRARSAMTGAALAHLDRLADLDAAPPTAIAQLRELTRARLAPADGEPPVLRQLRRDLIAVEAAELARLYDDGEIGAGTHRELQRRLDLEETSLEG
jgi:monovalent cation/hydrogen antiporter